jgi:hypothetical protein
VKRGGEVEYPMDQIMQSARRGESISHTMAIQLIQENLAMRGLLLQASELISEEDPVLLRKMNVNLLRDWREKVSKFMEYTKR